jgi:thymidylate synthase (FAD)
MKVDVLRSMERPERLACQTARGDYYSGYIGDEEYAALMEPVDTSRADRVAVMPDDSVSEGEDIPIESMSRELATEARTKSFIEKQLSRGHYGPWEHSQIAFSVKGISRVTMAQITRHRHMSFDVQSQRYVDFSETDAVVPATLLSREERIAEYPHVYDESGEHFNRDEGLFDMDDDVRAYLRERYERKTSEALADYEYLVSKGVPKEDARFILPLGTPVNMSFSGNARTMLHLFNLRQKQNSQWEIRELTNRLVNELNDWMPYTGQWWEENGPLRISP